MRVEHAECVVKPVSNGSSQAEPAASEASFKETLDRRVERFNDSRHTVAAGGRDEERTEEHGVHGLDVVVAKTRASVGSHPHKATRADAPSRADVGEPIRQAAAQVLSSKIVTARSPDGDAAVLCTIRCDELGSIHLLARSRPCGIEARLGTGDLEVARLLERNKSQLETRLERNGGRASVEVQVDSGAGGWTLVDVFREHVSGSACRGLLGGLAGGGVVQDLVELD